MEAIPLGTLLEQPSGIPEVNASVLPRQLPVQESFFESIMRLNQGKLDDVYMNFNSTGLSREVFTGVIVAGGRDNIVFRK